MMRRWGMLGMFLLSVAILARVTVQRESRQGENTTSTGAPRLEVDREIVDLGDVQLGKRVEATFRLSNVGDGELVILGAPYVQVVDGCCPPVPALGTRILGPAQQTTLSIAFVMAGDMGGPHDFRIHFETNDPNWKGRTLTVLSNWVESPTETGRENPPGR
jgi:hypothetical protein